MSLKQKNYFSPKKLTGKNIMETCNFIDKLSSGLYTFLPNGLKLLEKMINIIQHMYQEIGVNKISLPYLVPQSFFGKSNRINEWKDELFTTQDMVLSPTAEEIITSLYKKYISTFSDLPSHIVQIGNKYRNEKRPSFSLMRTYEFVMCDSYSIHNDEFEAIEEFDKVKKMYCNFFKICGIEDIFFKFSKNDEAMKSKENLEILINFSIGNSYKYCNKCKYCYDSTENKCNNCNEIINEKNISNFVEVAHLFRFDDFYSRALDFKIMNKKNNFFYPIMSSYGIGITRLMYIITEKYKDDHGLNLNIFVNPNLLNIIPTSDNNTDKAKKIYSLIKNIYKKFLKSQNFNSEVSLDLREKKGFGYKIKDSFMLGTLFTIVVGDKNIEVISRKNIKKNTLISEKKLSYLICQILKKRYSIYNS